MAGMLGKVTAVWGQLSFRNLAGKEGAMLPTGPGLQGESRRLRGKLTEIELFWGFGT